MELVNPGKVISCISFISKAPTEVMDPIARKLISAGFPRVKEALSDGLSLMDESQDVRIGVVANAALRAATKGSVLVVATVRSIDRYTIAVIAAAFAELRGYSGTAYCSLVQVDPWIAAGGGPGAGFEEREGISPLVVFDEAHGRLHDRTDRWLASILSERLAAGKRTIIFSMDPESPLPPLTAMVVKSAKEKKEIFLEI